MGAVAGLSERNKGEQRMILISGYYGCGNSGDEAVLAALCSDLVSLGVDPSEITVLSGNPEETAALHKVSAVPRSNFPAIVRAVRRSRLLISGGGSLLQDSTSWRTVPYYLLIIQLALSFGCKVVIYGQGIGPVSSRVYQRWIKSVFSRVHGISVRDAGSAQLLQDWGLDESVIITAADPVFNLQLDHRATAPGLTINLRPYPTLQADFYRWVDLINSWKSGLNLDVRFAALGPGDAEIGRKLQQEIPELEFIIAEDWNSAFRLMSAAEICVSMRLHGLIFAALGGSAPLGLCYDPKVAAVSSQLGIKVSSPQPDQDLTAELVQVRADRDDYLRRLAERVELMRTLSKKNRDVLAAAVRNK